MSLPTSLLAFQDCLEVFDKAVEDEHGIRVRFKSREEAHMFRMRLHQARKLQREENTRIYEEGHLMYGKSNYDGIKVTIRSLKSGNYVYLQHQVISAGQVESLANAEEEPDVFVSPPRSMAEKMSVEQLVTQSLEGFRRRV